MREDFSIISFEHNEATVLKETSTAGSMLSDSLDITAMGTHTASTEFLLTNNLMVNHGMHQNPH